MSESVLYEDDAEQAERFQKPKTSPPIMSGHCAFPSTAHPSSHMSGAAGRAVESSASPTGGLAPVPVLVPPG